MIYLPSLFGSFSPTKTFSRFTQGLSILFKVALSLTILLAISFNVMAEADIVSISDKEIAKRQSYAKEAADFVMKGQREWSNATFDKKALEKAYNHYLVAMEFLPRNSSTESQRKGVLDDFCALSIEYADQLISRGHFNDAQSVAKTVLSANFNPNYKPAAQLLSKLEQFGYYNKSITPSLANKIEQTEIILHQAAGFADTGRNDLAVKRYEEALRLDPYNKTARNGLERINNLRSKYYNSSFNETRARSLWLTERSWERPPLQNRVLERSTEGVNKITNSNKDAINRKLNGTIIQRIDLQDATIREVVDYLKQKSRELDTSTDDPQKKGVNIVINLPAPQAPSAPSGETLPQDQAPPNTPTENTKVSLSLNSVPLIVAIQYLAEQAKIKYKIDPFAISLINLGENTEALLTREFRVKPDFIQTDTDAEEPGPLAGNSIAGGNQDRIKGTKNATKHLKKQGIPFPEGAFAQYIPIGNKLIVRNTQGALDFIGAMVDSEMGMPPVLVEIESKFVEITQNNLKELGFDWLLGPLKIGDYKSAGGSRPYGQELNTEYYNNFPFGQTGMNPITASNRSGIGTNVNSAITANSLDSLLQNIPTGTNLASPGIFGLTGLLSNAQFQMVIRALNQKKGVDLMSAPKVTTKSGVKAVIRIVREFRYPTEFTPPEVAKSSGSNMQVQSSGGGITITPGAPQNTNIISLSSPITPSIPTSFESRNIGVTLEVEPTVGADNYTVDLDLSPEVVDFEGFVNYGSSVIAPRWKGQDLFNPSGIELSVLSENYINQPVFATRKVTTGVSVWDGQTVALGGLMREDVQKVEDKIPLLGDIPLAGRLFRSNVEQKIKRNLIIFVTARLMDAQGQPLKQENEDEDIVDPVGLPEDLPQPQVNTRSISK